MDRDELIFSEYRLYSEQKENFIERNFKTNRFYMASVFVLIVALIYTGNVIFLNKIFWRKKLWMRRSLKI